MNWKDEDISAGIEHCIEDAEDIFLVESKLNATRGGFQLIVKCESDTGINIDQLARINRSIQNAFVLPGLDTEQLSVEVSSPGSAFPVTAPRHFRRFAGHQMKIEHRSDAAKSPLVGEIVSADDESLTLKLSAGELRLALADIIQGTVELKW